MLENTVTTDESPENESEVLLVRREKLAKCRELGQAYPNHFKVKDFAEDLHEAYGNQSAEALETAQVSVQIAGRIMLRRVMGKASFVHIQDMTGKIQLYCRENDLAEGVYESFKHWDIGDIVGVTGIVFKTKSEELSIKVKTIVLLTKSLRPLPDKFHGITDTELRYRQRYLDLIMNEKSRRVFEVRREIINGIREFLQARRYVEVETPMMHVLAGGAAARPFVTHHNTLDMDLFLRIAPELYLKRLVVGGIERVFEINRNFRNEGISTSHNPEFTMIEFYEAYADYQDMINLTESLMRFLAERVLGSSQLTYQGATYDLSKPFKRFTVEQAICHYGENIRPEDIATLDGARKVAERLGLSYRDTDGLGKVWVEIFEAIAEPKLYEPTFITEYPTEVSPLARCNDANPFVTDRFEFFVGGFELANGFSELNDPEDQAARFDAQMKEKAAGDIEAMPYDEDYIRALEYGLPPAAGEGIGIDRLTMFFTDSLSIRDVILFPHMRPE